MLIDKGKLIALLVEKTGYDRDKVEEQFAQLVNRISKVSKQGDFAMEGFGTFTQKDDGLHFDPAEKLKTEINQKYAGMKPIELIGAYKQTGKGVPVEPEPSEPKQEKPKEKRPKKRKKQKKKESVLPAESPPQRKKPVKEKPKARQKKVKKAYPAKKRSHSGAILVAGIIIIAILAGGFFLYDSDRTGFNSTLATADSTAQGNNHEPGNAFSANAPDSGRMAGAQPDSMEQNAPDSVSEKKPQVQKSSAAIYGLKGLATSEGNNGYTIVIHSFQLKSTVQGIADSLQNEGYRTVLINATIDDSSRWRLGLGQFQTVHDAQNAVPELPEKYKAPDKHFIKHI